MKLSDENEYPFDIYSAFDVVNGGIHLARGNYVDAAFSFAGEVVDAGIGIVGPAGIAKIQKLAKAANVADATTDAEKVSRATVEAGKKMLAESGAIPDRGSMTRAGREFQKHGSRIPDPKYPKAGQYPSSKGLSREAMDSEGMRILEEIINSPNKWFKKNNLGGFDIIDSLTGRGARFNSKGIFDRFL